MKWLLRVYCPRTLHINNINTKLSLCWRLRHKSCIFYPIISSQNAPITKKRLPTPRSPYRVMASNKRIPGWWSIIAIYRLPRLLTDFTKFLCSWTPHSLSSLLSSTVLSLLFWAKMYNKAKIPFHKNFFFFLLRFCCLITRI